MEGKMTTSINHLTTNDVVQDMLTEIRKGNNLTSAQILQTAMNLLMVAERNLPPYQRDAEEREHIIRSLLTNGYSPNAIRRSLNDLSLHYNPKELEQIKDEYLVLYRQWQNRQLPQDVIAMFIDVYHCEASINNKVCKAALYVIVGIDFNGQKDLFGLYLYEGSETKSFMFCSYATQCASKYGC
jgi:transposase-like protein